MIAARCRRNSFGPGKSINHRARLDWSGVKLSRCRTQVVGYGAQTSGKTMNIDNIIVEGELTAVPEPSTTTTAVGLALLAWGMLFFKQEQRPAQADENA